MAREYLPDDLARRIFVISAAGVSAFIVVTFVWIIL